MILSVFERENEMSWHCVSHSIMLTVDWLTWTPTLRELQPCSVLWLPYTIESEDRPRPAPSKLYHNSKVMPFYIIKAKQFDESTPNPKVPMFRWKVNKGILKGTATKSTILTRKTTRLRTLFAFLEIPTIWSRLQRRPIAGPLNRQYELS